MAMMIAILNFERNLVQIVTVGYRTSSLFKLVTVNL